MKMQRTKGLHESEDSQWFVCGTESPRAIALVTHGLNLRPSRLNDLVSFLNSENVDCYRPSLFGEKGDCDDYINSHFESWKTQIQNWIKEGKSRASRNAVPLILVGYSLGALGPLTVALQSELNPFDGAILFAPALRLRWTNKLILLFSVFGKKFRVPSLSRRDYRALSWTPVSAYQTLFKFISIFVSLNSETPKKLDIPTLVFIEPHDELVSGAQTQKMAAGFTFWKVESVRRNGYPHHLIIDREALGEVQWQRVTQKISEFLKLISRH